MKRTKQMDQDELLKALLQNTSRRPLVVATYLLGLFWTTSLCELLTNCKLWGVPLQFISVAIGLAAFMWLTIYTWRRNHTARPFSLRVSTQRPRGACGLILLVSPYSPHRDRKDLKDRELLAGLLQTVKDTSVQHLSADMFDRLGIEESNWKPLLYAVNHHFNQGLLKDVWLIHTETERLKNGTTKTGSDATVAVLRQYLRFRYSGEISVHDSLDYRIRSAKYGDLWRKAEEIFSKADYKPDAILADITGGTALMSVALAMACVDPGRRMQYMDTQRDWKGEPTDDGNPRPILIDVDPIFDSE